MHIKRLEIQGFKTFADRTELGLTSGITAVVGPNGSGKSNIADAISWVVGEQNMRNLRSSRAHDVIFAGSEKRKPLGMSEVSLTIDNSCGTLPLDFAEVTITRRVFRSGDSEYLINKAPCRLKDIYELFLDTGMGREAYSMVSQGEIDAILSAKSEDRRSLIEEAAGIKKYRFRRKEAQRKLENTEGNLRRVNDIVCELQDQVEPLAQQAEEAKRFNELTSRLREIETGLLINDLRRWSGELERIKQTKEDSSKLIEEQDKRISDLEWDKEKLIAELTALDKRVDSARIKHQEANTAAQRIESSLALAEERRKGAEETRHRLEAEIKQLETRIAEAKNRLERLKLEETGYTERETCLAADVSERSKALEQATADLAAASKIVEDRKAAYLDLAKDQASKKAEIENLRHRQAQLEVAVTKYATELKSLEENREDVARRLEEARAKGEELRAKQKTRDEELPPLVEKRNWAQTKISTCNNELSDIGRATVGKASRLSTLQEMADSHEGFFEGVRAVMKANKFGKLHGSYAVVADVITVPKGYETAMEVALGSSVQDVIADTVEDSKEAIRFLKENRLGRATFLPLDGVRPNTSGVGDLRHPGVKGVAADLVSFDRKYTPAIEVLLGRVVVVDNIDNAVKLSRSTSGWGRIVTLEGEVIVPTGAMTGGMKAGKGPNLISRKQEIDTLTKELNDLDKSRDRVESELSNYKDTLTAVSKDIEEIESAAASDKVALVEADRQSEYLTKECARIDQQITVVTAEKKDAETTWEDDTTALTALEAQLSQAGQENIDLDEMVAGAMGRVDELNKKREALNEEMMEMSVMLASIRERRMGIGQTIQQTRKSIEDMDFEMLSRSEDIKNQSEDASANDHNMETLNSEVAASKVALETAQIELSELLSERSELAQKSTTLDAELKSLNHARTETAELIRDCDVRDARLEIQMAQTTERLLLEYEITQEEALASEEQIELERGTSTEVGRLRREIKLMGPVNTGAIQEYERISERWEFLTTQKSDLETAREKLQSAIKEIDASTKDLFMTTFYAVQEHFDKMFKMLFNGGKTELVLTDPSNVLDTGVEIIVQPPGKKLQNLTLLSGGERALTASALLFALLMVKPSPFVLFDEVDAPLDDSNVERFAEVLKKFSADTQFIVVTHNRATMEAADTLYGVTMQEPGVSKLISVQLSDITERGDVEDDFLTVGRN